MDIAKTPLENIIREFVAHRLDVSMDGVDMPEGDAVYFEKILRGVVENQTPIDRKIDDCLSENWHLARLDSTLRAILRCGVLSLPMAATHRWECLFRNIPISRMRFLTGPKAE